MTEKDLNLKIKSLLKQGESYKLEFKSARGGMPASLWESYSAFANTDGGTIILGIHEYKGKFQLEGLTKEIVDRYKKNFWDTAHNKGKVSVCLLQENDVIEEEVDGAYILICNIPRANYNQRPVYLNNIPFGNTYRRNHEGDYLCTNEEVRHMFADADHDRKSQDYRILVGFNIERDIDKETLRQFRQTFASLQPLHPWVSLDDIEFMKKIGAYAVEYETGREGITLAGLLMFGKYDSITNISGDPNFFVDYKERIATNNPDVRWTHRIYPDGLWEANLYQFYVKVYNRLIQVLPRPFIIRNGVRQEETPAHDAVREALINCIIHQQLYALGNISIEMTDKAMVFKNPGTLLVSKRQYYEGGKSICRNPNLQKMFMLLGRAEKAGSGVDKIVNGWRYLGWTDPVVEETTSPDYVVLTMKIGEKTNIKANDQQQQQEQQQNSKKHLSREEKKKDRMQKILDFCVEPKSLVEIMEFLKLKHRGNLFISYLNPLTTSGDLTMTDYNQKSKNQKYMTVKRIQDKKR